MLKRLTKGVGMARKRRSEEEIIRILKESEAGVKVSEICRKYGISDATYYNWKAKFGGLDISEVRRLRQLEDENRKLKTIVADLTLDNSALKAIIEKKW